MIGVIDEDKAFIYWCDSSAQADDVIQMLELVGVPYRQI